MSSSDSSKNLTFRVPRLNADTFQANLTPDGLTILASRRVFMLTNGENSPTNLETEPISVEPLMLVDLSPRSAKSLHLLLTKMIDLYEANWESVHSKQSDKDNALQQGFESESGGPDEAVTERDQGDLAPAVANPDQEFAMAS